MRIRKILSVVLLLVCSNVWATEPSDLEVQACISQYPDKVQSTIDSFMEIYDMLQSDPELQSPIKTSGFFKESGIFDTLTMRVINFFRNKDEIFRQEKYGMVYNWFFIQFIDVKRMCAGPLAIEKSPDLMKEYEDSYMFMSIDSLDDKKTA